MKDVIDGDLCKMHFTLCNDMMIDAELDRLVRGLKRKISVSGRFPEFEILPELNTDKFCRVPPWYGVTSPMN